MQVCNLNLGKGANAGRLKYSSSKDKMFLCIRKFESYFRFRGTGKDRHWWRLSKEMHCHGLNGEKLAIQIKVGKNSRLPQLRMFN